MNYFNKLLPIMQRFTKTNRVDKDSLSFLLEFRNSKNYTKLPNSLHSEGKHIAFYLLRLSTDMLIGLAESDAEHALSLSQEVRDSQEFPRVDPFDGEFYSFAAFVAEQANDELAREIFKQRYKLYQDRYQYVKAIKGLTPLLTTNPLDSEVVDSEEDTQLSYGNYIPPLTEAAGHQNIDAKHWQDINKKGITKGITKTITLKLLEGTDLTSTEATFTDITKKRDRTHLGRPHWKDPNVYYAEIRITLSQALSKLESLLQAPVEVHLLFDDKGGEGEVFSNLSKEKRSFFLLELSDKKIDATLLLPQK